jgi:1-acyl-sn-glycerol-3-phosphate acyltransferase
MNGVPRRSGLWCACQVISRIASTLVFGMKVYGRHNIPRRGGVLLLSNHQSYLDPILLAVPLRRPVSYMAKSELFERGAFFTWLIRSLHAFPIRKNTADVGAIKEAIGRLGEGHILNMYPEGTRTRTGEIGPILPGVAVVVRRAGVPVVPVVIDGTFQAWAKGSKVPRPHPVRIMYGKPLRIKGLKTDQVVEKIGQTLREMLAELRRREQSGP